jgi:hypothetical protein
MKISTQHKKSQSPLLTPGSAFQSRPFAPSVQLQSSQNPTENLSLSPISQAPSGLQPRSLLQCKLSIGQVGDHYEQEADRVAQQVVQRLNAPSSVQTQAQEPMPDTTPFHAHVQRSILQAAPSQNVAQPKPIGISSTGTAATVQRLPGQKLFSNPMMQRYLKMKAMQGMNYMGQKADEGMQYMSEKAQTGMQYAQGVAQQYPTQSKMFLDFGQEKLEEWAGRDAMNIRHAMRHLNGKTSDEEFYHGKDFQEFTD